MMCTGHLRQDRAEEEVMSAFHQYRELAGQRTALLVDGAEFGHSITTQPSRHGFVKNAARVGEKVLGGAFGVVLVALLVVMP
jgi:hypothetical protein